VLSTIQRTERDSVDGVLTVRPRGIGRTVAGLQVHVIRVVAPTSAPVDAEPIDVIGTGIDATFVRSRNDLFAKSSDVLRHHEIVSLIFHRHV
jgi:hypothetical protein